MNDTTTNGRVAPGAAPAGGAEWDPFVPSHFEEVRGPGATRPPIASIVHELSGLASGAPPRAARLEVLEHLDLAQALLGLGLRGVGAEPPSGRLRQHHVLPVDPLDHLPESDRRANVLADEADDVLGRCAGREELLDADRLEGGDVLRGNDPAPEDRDVAGALLGEQLEDPLEEVVVGAREDGEPDGVGVLLDRRGDDLLGRLVEPRVDDLEARVAQRARDDLRPAVVAVEPRLGDHDADRPFDHQWPPPSAARSFSPTFIICARSPGTTFQSNPLPSLVQRGIRCRWKCGTD